MDTQKKEKGMLVILMLLVQYLLFEKKVKELDKEKDDDKINELFIQYCIEVIIFLVCVQLSPDASIVLESIIFVLTIL